MTVNAVDATGLSPSQITALKNAGVKIVGRYLSHSAWKGLTLGEVANLKAAGMQIFSIYESNPTKSSYFNADKGKSDALDALALAKAVGQPAGSAIYFTVDYDAQAVDLAAILAYFQSVKANLSGYKVGAYGSYTVLNYLHENKAADYWYQTIAWSYGQRCNFLNIYQFQEDKTLAGVQVDFDNLETADIGAWDQSKPAPVPPPKTVTADKPVAPKPAASAPVAPAPKPHTQIGTVTATVDNLHVRKDHDGNSPIVGMIHKSDGAFKTYDLVYGWYNIGLGWVSDNYVTFKKI